MRRDISSAFGKILRRDRLAAGLSQEALAHKAGLHRIYVGMIERGDRRPTLEVVAALAKALGYRLSEWVRELET